MKALIMLVRLLGLASIILGALLWAEHASLLGAHIAVGFIVAMCIFALGVVAMVKKAVVPGVIGVIFSVLLPVFGFLQLPVTYHTLRLIQIVHVIVALCIIGLGERLYAAIRAAK